MCTRIIRAAQHITNEMLANTYPPAPMDQNPSWEVTGHSASKETPTFYGTQRFITMFTRAHHWSQSWGRCIQSTHYYPISIRSILILFSHLHLDLPCGLLPSDFPTKIMFTICPSHPPLIDRPNNIWWTVQVVNAC